MEQAQADTKPEILSRIEAIAAGRSDRTQDDDLKSLVLNANVQHRWSGT
jgi:hypothetical protein